MVISYWDLQALRGAKEFACRKEGFIAVADRQGFVLEKQDCIVSALDDRRVQIYGAVKVGDALMGDKVRHVFNVIAVRGVLAQVLLGVDPASAASGAGDMVIRRHTTTIDTGNFRRAKAVIYMHIADDCVQDGDCWSWH